MCVLATFFNKRYIQRGIHAAFKCGIYTTISQEIFLFILQHTICGIIATMNQLKTLKNALKSKVARSGLRATSREMNISVDTLRSVISGRIPLLSNAEKICRGLGLEFHIGPPDKNKNLILEAQKSDKKVRESVPAYTLETESKDIDYIWVPKLEVKLAVGHDKTASHKQPAGMLAFQRTWIRKNKIHPGKVSAVDISGDSMAPYLNDGDTILINHARTRRKRGLVVVARVRDELFVKRLEQTPDGDWLLVSDNYQYTPLSLGVDDTVLGEVVWRGRWL